LSAIEKFVGLLICGKSKKAAGAPEMSDTRPKKRPWRFYDSDTHQLLLQALKAIDTSGECGDRRKEHPEYNHLT
jgi:hypothetical protein